MFPGIYGFEWDAGHIIFLGVFYTVLVVVASTLVVSIRRTIHDHRSAHREALQWHLDFEELPASVRRCRHELAGEIEQRECPNAFDCRHCQDHPKFAAVETSTSDEYVAGFRLPAGCFHHRGHTCVKLEDDGTVTVGLDDFAARLIGTPDELRLPDAGSHLTANGTAVVAKKNGSPLRILSPVDGEVVESAMEKDGRWRLRIRPDVPDLRHLLRGREARAWMMREVERLQFALGNAQVGMALADGGMPLDDLSAVVPPDQLDAVYGQVFLEP